jgi:peptide/nickel transport system substrate-binding protein
MTAAIIRHARKRRFVAGLAATVAWLIAAAALVALGGPLAGTTGTAAGAQYKPVETLRINLQFTLDSVDPAFAYQQPSWQLEYATCAKLVNYPDGPWAPDQVPEPEVAAGPPDISADGLTYTFKIQKTFRFSPPSKERVTAETFKASIERTLSPAINSPGVTFLRDVVGAEEYHAGTAGSISGITASKNDLVIQLERPVGDLPARLATPFFCAVPIGTPVDPSANAVVPAAGPYYVESFNREGLTVLRSNPNYTGHRPQNFDAIVYQARVPAATTEAAIIAGTVDYAADGLPADDYAAIDAAYGPGSPAAQAGAQQFFVNPVLGTWYLGMNTSRPLFSNVLLRQAVNYALDRPALSAAAGPRALTPTDQILPPLMPGFRDWNLYPLDGPDLAQAQALAAASGQVPATAVLYTCNIPRCVSWGQTIKSSLAAIGIDVQVQHFPRQEQFTRTSIPGEPYDLTTEGWAADWADPWDFIDVLLHGDNAPGAGGNNTNFAYFDDPAFNQRMDAAEPLQPPGRFDTYGELDRDIIADGAPWAPFASIHNRDFFSARIGCHAFNPLFGMDLAALCLR